MNQKGFINLLLIVIVVALVGMGSYFILNRQVSPPPFVLPPTPTPTPPPANNENARTLYEGYVGIETISLSEIKTKLETLGCHTIDYFTEGAAINSCMYKETEVIQLKENGIEIYPRGPGFGPISFYVTGNKLWADKDIPGPPNPENFKAAVRQDVTSIGGIVKIKETSWKITKTEYPWTVIY